MCIRDRYQRRVHGTDCKVHQGQNQSPICVEPCKANVCQKYSGDHSKHEVRTCGYIGKVLIAKLKAVQETKAREEAEKDCIIKQLEKQKIYVQELMRVQREARGRNCHSTKGDIAQSKSQSRHFLVNIEKTKLLYIQQGELKGKASKFLRRYCYS
eukprot:TRINITY_DN12272_c0_g1_i2.p2 TRINITY_DN12272_c0_g1~~TRINITY_DN12272_c0_g1_i2.p2  ORF type:complete len:155 (+),score=15.93 TRINITY_DN12272_c0_g1_i2:141-605(+)